jgi:hypothetical protein
MAVVTGGLEGIAVGLAVDVAAPTFGAVVLFATFNFVIVNSG